MRPDRRKLVQALVAAPILQLAGCLSTANKKSPFRITLCGQTLMSYSLCNKPYDGMDEIVAELQRGDVVFTDLEVAIQTAASGAPTRDTQFLHMASPDVLRCLDNMGFNLLALSNNHAWDLGTAGVLATREAVRRQGFVAAGTGENLAAAAAPAFFETRGRRVALVATATEKIREGAAATSTRAGVNELRLVAGVPVAEDIDRILGSIRLARLRADFVIAYHHNHDWGDDMRVTRPWAREFARRCAEAGADIYVSHGAPLLHGIDRHNDSLLFYGLGSLVFHSRTDVGYYPREVWESAIVHCNYVDGALSTVDVVPVVLNERGDDPEQHQKTRGRPRIATGDDAKRILERLAAMTTAFGPSGVILP